MKSVNLYPVNKKAMQMFCISFLISSMSLDVFSQCSVSIPSQATVINTNTTLMGGGEVVWVCSGATVNDLGGGVTAYLEGGATYSGIGGGSTIYAKNGSTIQAIGGGEIFWHESGASISALGGGETWHLCNPLTYNYSNAPANGCVVQGIFSMGNTNIISVDLFPNPIISSFTLSINNDKNFKQFTFVLYNVLGEEVKRVENITQDEMVISRGDLQSGIYMYQLLNENTIVNTGKMVME